MRSNLIYLNLPFYSMRFVDSDTSRFIDCKRKFTQKV